jgi:excisionase family DNA binding protein
MSEELTMPADRGSTVLTIDELSKYLKISKSTLYKLAQEGSIPSQKVGKHWRFHKDAVDQWLRQRGPSTFTAAGDTET